MYTEKISEESSSKAMAANNYPEELQEKGEAGLILASLKYLKLDSKTTNDLRELKSKFLGGIRVNPVAENQPELPQINAFGVAGDPYVLPQFELPMPNWNSPKLPPVSRLNGLIGRCSRPFEKQLTDSDVKYNQSSLLLNKVNVQKCILPLLNLEENLENGIPVTIYDFEGNEFQMTFKIWGSKNHVLTGVGWKKFCHNHKLKALQDFITVWMFRHVQTEKLCFVITSRRLQVSRAIKGRRMAQDLAMNIRN